VGLFGRKKKSSSGGSNVLRTYEKLINEGFDAIKRGDEDKAIITFRKVLRWISEDMSKITAMSDKDKKELSKMLTDVGEEMVKLKEYDVAIKILEKAKTIDPKNFRAWMDIGKDLLQRNTQIPYALVCLREAAKLRPENVEIHLLLGDAYRIQGQKEKALAAYQKALKVDPENPTVLEKVLRIQPENIEILEKYIAVLEKSGDKEELLKNYNKIVAITGNEAYLERGLQIDPNNKDLLLNKAQLLLKEDNVKEAKNILSGLIKKYPDDPNIKMLYDELMGTEEPAPEEKPNEIGVGDVFGDLSLEESTAPAPDVTEDLFNAPEEPMHTETHVEQEQKTEEEKKPEEKPEEKEAVPEAAPEPAPAEKVETPSEPEQKESKSEPEQKIEEAPAQEKELTPEEKFINAYKEKKLDVASAVLEEMGDSVKNLMNQPLDVLKFIYSHLLMAGNYDLASDFIAKIAELEPSEENKIEQARILIECGKMDEAEVLLNDIVKKNMKNGRALYLKARIQTIKGNDMGARNFLMMATKFNPELKEEAKDDAYFEKYQSEEWFKKIVS